MKESIQKCEVVRENMQKWSMVNDNLRSILQFFSTNFKMNEGGINYME